MQQNNKLLRYFFLAFALFATMFSYYIWQITKTPNYEVDEKKGFALLIPKGATFETVWDSLSKHKIVKDELSFKFLAKLLKYKDNVREGRYVIKADMGNYEVIKKLRSGNQDAIKLTFNNIRLKKDLVHKIGNRFEFDSTALATMLEDTAVARKYGFTKETIMCMFLPNTYEVYWNTSPDELMNTMKTWYDKFWTEERKRKATEIGLDPIRAQIMASIVEAETKKADEKPRVAGVYMNRLNTNMPLGADPTVIFAHQDFSIKRVTKALLQINSPYNTYRVVGLPPGPINLPDLASIDAVLNYEHHKYLYFCAKEDFSGYHNFAETFADHLNNARIYQEALNKLNIRK
ncbi:MULTISPECIES: endolytic transglycosylase MltG [Arcicella]|uniref:Endolytic murein transglycosylase n=1 Tax=Arcicella lustrica TaxID=2984196 RepID=A0ABU5SNZ5_9BACT|nr:endolytic transglycosylase MltG [Arcicella sp. DC25W]MEA5429034.1 endolytic transglycosylase MltG [Arcicella sp. DC25W]